VAHRLVAEHSDQHRPLAAYGALVAAFGVAAGAGLLAAGRADRLPSQVEARDLALYGVATAKLSRLQGA
jgi:hypothetical protein